MLKGHWWSTRVTLPIRVLATQASDLSRLSPLGACSAPSFNRLRDHGLRLAIPVSNLRQSAEESNPILQIWNLLGHHDLHPIGDHRVT